MTITPGADDEYEARDVHRPARNRVNPKIPHTEFTAEVT
jgi:hypothetical protein